MTTDDAQPASRRPAPVQVIATLAVLLALLALIGLVQARGDAADLKAAEKRRSEALTAARSFAAALTTYDYRKIGDQVAQVSALATDTPDCKRDAAGKAQAGSPGCFKSEYELVTSKAFRDVVVSEQATSLGTVISAGVVSTTSDRAVVLVALDQKVTNKSNPSGKTILVRAVVTLLHKGGKWLTSDVRVNALTP